MVNIQNIDDNECFKWSLVRYLHPVDHYSATIAKADKDFAKKLGFKNITFPVKIRGICKIEKKKILLPIVSTSGQNKLIKMRTYIAHQSIEH